MVLGFRSWHTRAPRPHLPNGSTITGCFQPQECFKGHKREYTWKYFLNSEALSESNTKNTELHGCPNLCHAHDRMRLRTICEGRMCYELQGSTIDYNNNNKSKVWLFNFLPENLSGQIKESGEGETNGSKPEGCRNEVMLRLLRHLAVEELRECKQYLPTIPWSQVPLTCTLLYGPTSYAIVFSWGVCSVFYKWLWSLALGSTTISWTGCGQIRNMRNTWWDYIWMTYISKYFPHYQWNYTARWRENDCGGSMFTSGRQRRKCSLFFTLPRVPNMKDHRENMVGLSK